MGCSGTHTQGHTLTIFPARAVGVAVEWYTPHTYHTPTDFPAGAVGVAGLENPLEWYTHQAIH